VNFNESWFDKSGKYKYKIDDDNKTTILKHGDYICNCSECGGRVIIKSGGYYSGIYISCQICKKEVYSKDWLRMTFKRAESLFNNPNIKDEIKYKDKFNHGMVLSSIYNLYKQYGKESDIKDLSKCLEMHDIAGEV